MKRTVAVCDVCETSSGGPCRELRLRTVTLDVCSACESLDIKRLLDIAKERDTGPVPRPDAFRRGSMQEAVSRQDVIYGQPCGGCFNPPGMCKCARPR